MAAGDLLATNLVRNPSAESDLTDWESWPGDGVVQVTRETSGGRFGGAFHRMTWTTASSSGAAGPFVYNDAPGLASVVAGDVVAGALFVRPSTTRNMQLAIQFRDIASGVVRQDYTGVVPCPANQWTKLPFAGLTAPAGTDRVSLFAFTAGPGYAVGETLDADGAILVYGTTVLDYFDGDTPDTDEFEYLWLGTPHASASEKREAEPALPTGVTFIDRSEDPRTVGGWRYLAQRLTGGDCPTDDFLDLNLPLQDVSITDTLSGPPQLSGTLTPEVARLIQADGKPLMTKYHTAIYAERDGEIEAGGILTEPQWNGHNLSLECLGFCDYPKDQPWTDPNSYLGVNVDPIDVVRVIWDHLQAQPGGDLRMELDRDTKAPFKIGSELLVAEFDPADDPDTGPTSFEVGPVMLRWFETYDLGGFIDDLAQKTPFDFHERHQWDGDVIRHHLDFGYPRIGRKRNDLRFVVGENIYEVPQLVSDEYATEVLALGAGEGRTMKMARISNRQRFQLRRAVKVENKQARTIKDITAYAKQELAWRNGTDDMTELAVVDHPHASVRDISVGDEIYVEGRTSDWNHIEMWVRVIQKTYSPGTEEGSAKLSVIRADKVA